MRRSLKSNFLYKHKWWGSVSLLIVGTLMVAPSVGAEDVNLQLQIVAPDCHVSQVFQNGEMQNVFTPTGCDKTVQPTTPPPIQQPDLQPTDIPPVGLDQSSPATHLSMPSSPVGSPVPLAQPQKTPSDDRVAASPAATRAATQAAETPVVLTATAAVAAGVGVAIAVHSASAAAAAAATAAGSSSTAAAAGGVGITRRVKNKKRRKEP